MKRLNQKTREEKGETRDKGSEKSGYVGKRLKRKQNKKRKK